jgi:hypothetical protein
MYGLTPIIPKRFRSNRLSWRDRRRSNIHVLPYINELRRVEYFDFIDFGDSIQCGYYVPTPAYLRNKDGRKPYIIQLQFQMCRNCGNYIKDYLSENPKCTTSKHIYCSC